MQKSINSSDYNEFCISYKNINYDSDSDSDYDDLLLDSDIYNKTYINSYNKNFTKTNYIKEKSTLPNINYKISSSNDFYITDDDEFTTDIAKCITNIIKVNYNINDIDYYIFNDDCMIEILYKIIKTLYDMDQTIEKNDFQNKIQNIKNSTIEKITEILNSEQFKNELNEIELLQKNDLLDDAISILDNWLSKD